MDNSFIAFKKLMVYIKPWRFKLILASIYSILNKLFDLAPEILIGFAVDLVVNKEDSFVATIGFESLTSQMIFLGVATFLIWLFESIFQYLYMVNWRNLAQNLENNIRIDGYRHVQKLDMDWYENQHTGNITAILNDDINQLERFLDSGANNIIQIIVSTLAVGGIFFYISPLIACITIIPIPLILIIAFFFQKNISPRYHSVREAAGLISSTIFNNLLGIQTIKSFIQEDTENSRIKKISINYQSLNKSAIKLSSAFIPIVRMGILSGFLGTMIIGGFKTLNGEIAVGSYSVLVFLTQRFLWPFTTLGEMVDQFERAMASTRRILNLINTDVKIKDLDNPKKLDHYRSRITFENVKFKYYKSHTIFNNINLEIESGKILGVVGPTGSGKTTLAKLLLRFYDPIDGKITIDGLNIRELQLKKLRENIGFVSQEIFLFDGTIRENICYSHRRFNKHEMLLASKKSQAHEFISKMPKKYDTKIGERGQKLSVGQKQRIAIARAIYKDPPIFIFDEATSAVDNQTEKLIQEAISAASKGRTTIIIAHRLSTIRHADRIIVLNESKIIEDGNHEELTKIKNGCYANLWKIQTGNLFK